MRSKHCKWRIVYVQLGSIDRVVQTSLLISWCFRREPCSLTDTTPLRGSPLTGACGPQVTCFKLLGRFCDLRQDLLRNACSGLKCRAYERPFAMGKYWQRFLLCPGCYSQRSIF